MFVLVTDDTLRKVMSVYDQGILATQVGLIAKVKLHFFIWPSFKCVISRLLVPFVCQHCSFDYVSSSPLANTDIQQRILFYCETAFI